MGEAKRRRDREMELDTFGHKRPRDEVCPACRSARIIHVAAEDMPDAKCEMGACKACGAIWEDFPAEYARDEVCAEPCDNCAFRPGSPEQQDREGWANLLAKLRPDPSGMSFREVFYCHKGVPIDTEKGAGNFRFPLRAVEFEGRSIEVPDTSRMRTCSGFLRMVWALNAKRGKESV